MVREISWNNNVCHYGKNVKTTCKESLYSNDKAYPDKFYWSTDIWKYILKGPLQNREVIICGAMAPVMSESRKRTLKGS